MDDLALTLDVAVGLEERRVAGGGVVLVVDLRPEDQVTDAGLVLQRDEHDARGGAGALADQHQPGHLHPLAVGRALVVHQLLGGDHLLFR